VTTRRQICPYTVPSSWCGTGRNENNGQVGDLLMFGALNHSVQIKDALAIGAGKRA
jgi:hypothetical protein